MIFIPDAFFYLLIQLWLSLSASHWQVMTLYQKCFFLPLAINHSQSLSVVQCIFSGLAPLSSVFNSSFNDFYPAFLVRSCAPLSLVQKLLFLNSYTMLSNNKIRLDSKLCSSFILSSTWVPDSSGTLPAKLHIATACCRPSLLYWSMEEASSLGSLLVIYIKANLQSVHKAAFIYCKIKVLFFGVLISIAFQLFLKLVL